MKALEISYGFQVGIKPKTLVRATREEPRSLRSSRGGYVDKTGLTDGMEVPSAPPG